MQHDGIIIAPLPRSNGGDVMAVSFNIEDVIANSYRDFHAKGLDYICLSRTDELTVKFYFLDGDVSKIPEVVNPHDHRYEFDTTVIAGGMIDHRYKADEFGDIYQAFDYRTPLNNGDGFSFRQEERLSRYSSDFLERGASLHSNAVARHTIQMTSDQTILMLRQYCDVLPLECPTSCWVRKGNPKPDTTGLYSKFTADQVLDRLNIISRITGDVFVESPAPSTGSAV
jgi:hypothetical protein